MWAVGRLSLLSRRRTAKPAPATGTRENIAIDPEPEGDKGLRTPDVSDRQEKLNTPRVIVQASKVRETAEPARVEPAPRVIERPTEVREPEDAAPPAPEIPQPREEPNAPHAAEAETPRAGRESFRPEGLATQVEDAPADDRAGKGLDARPQPSVPDPAPQGFFARVVRRVRSLFQSIFG